MKKGFCAFECTVMDKGLVWKITQPICYARVQQYLHEADEQLNLFAKEAMSSPLPEFLSVRSRMNKIPHFEGRKRSK